MLYVGGCLGSIARTLRGIAKRIRVPIGECGEDPGTLDPRFLGDYERLMRPEQAKEAYKTRSLLELLTGRR